MTTALVLGPTDHGRPMSLEEFESARGLEGHRYELIHGKVYVSPVPKLPHDFLIEWLDALLAEHSRQHPEQINYVFSAAAVYAKGSVVPSRPEPDLVAFKDFPRRLPLQDLKWRDLHPVLVVEIISDDDPEKDLERNVEIYLQVPTVREYWILDPRPDPDRPSLIVYRRRGDRWQNPIHVEFGGTYTTKLLPGFVLLLDPHAQD